jgi:DNA adenine methylase
MTATLFRHLGGKSRLARRLLPLLPPHECYVEPFAGAASLFFAKMPSKIEVLNDLDGEIVNFMRCLQRRPWELVAHLLFQPYSRTDREVAKLGRDPVERAATWFFLKQSSFGGMGPGNAFATGALSVNNAVAFRNRVAGLVEHALRLRDAIVEGLHFEEVVRRYDRPSTFFYCDPPYPDCASYEGLVFEERDHRRLADALDGIQGRALVNYHDHPLVRELYQGWHTLSLESTLLVKPGRSGRRRVQLLCLTNYRPPS